MSHREVRVQTASRASRSFGRTFKFIFFRTLQETARVSFFRTHPQRIYER